MIRAPLLVAALLAIGPAAAIDVPQASGRDHRIQRVNYHSGDVVVARATVGVGLRIVFEPGEQIIDAVLGFPTGWQVTPSRHILYVMPQSVGTIIDGVLTPDMPVSGDWDTNLMVSTDRRLYDIDLRLIDSERVTVDDRVSYRIEYHYPDEQAARLVAEQVVEDEQDAVVDAMRAARTVANRDYTMQVGKGSAHIAPGMAYDDGVFTYLRFAANAEMPAVFVINQDGTESMVVSQADAKQPGLLVIQRVAAEFVLRLGLAVVGVYNEAFDPQGVRMTSGTTVPGVRRADRGIAP